MSIVPEILGSQTRDALSSDYHTFLESVCLGGLGLAPTLLRLDYEHGIHGIRIAPELLPIPRVGALIRIIGFEIPSTLPRPYYKRGTSIAPTPLHFRLLQSRVLPLGLRQSSLTS